MRKKLKKTFVSVIGFAMLIIGIILIPYPGPGWLVVFAALGILSTEYAWAQRLLIYGRKKLDDWSKWVQRQNPAVQLSISLFTLAVTLVTVWLTNVYGVVDDFFDLGYDWTHSPLPMFEK